MEKKPPRKKYPPKEGWKAYNEKLVKRGELYFNLEFLKDLQRELKKLNKRKRGRPFDYPDSLIQFCAIIYHFFHLPHRQMEGLLVRLNKIIPELPTPDYSTPCRRFSDLDLEFPRIKSTESLVIAVDSSGIKVTNRGEWMREKRGNKRKGWIKVHIAVDVKSKKLVALEVTDEETGDSKMFKPLVSKIGNLANVLADGAYDTKENFSYLTERGLGPPGIKIRENASGKGMSDRAFAVREFMELGYDKWKKKHGYGRRWSSEGFFSAVKRIFGECVIATSVEGAIREVKMKFMFYNMVLSL